MISAGVSVAFLLFDQLFMQFVLMLAGGVCTDTFGSASSAFAFALIMALLAFAAQWIILSPRNLEPWTENSGKN